METSILSFRVKNRVKEIFGLLSTSGKISMPEVLKRAVLLYLDDRIKFNESILLSEIQFIDFADTYDTPEKWEERKSKNDGLRGSFEEMQEIFAISEKKVKERQESVTVLKAFKDMIITDMGKVEEEEAEKTKELMAAYKN